MFGFGKEKEKVKEEEMVEIRILPALVEAAESQGEDLGEWLENQITLAYVVDAGRIYQFQGGKFVQLSMKDVRPYNESFGNIKTGDEYEFIGLYQNAYDEVRNKGTDDFRTWGLKVVNLGLMAPNMGLHFLNDEGEYLPIYVSAGEEETPSV